MIEWADDGIVLAVRPLGEGGAVASLLCREHGRRAGMVPGGTSKSGRGALQPGNGVRAVWKARLADQLGHFRIELDRAHAALVLEEPAKLNALSAACALCETVLPEGESHPAIYAAFSALLQAFEGPVWPSVYVHWEIALLRDLGFGLDLSQCAAGGPSEDLVWVSPKTGRAVSGRAGEPWKHRLLPLPAFLTKGGEGDEAQIAAGLALTGYFLDRFVLGPARRSMPAARLRLVDRFGPSASMSGL